MKNHLGPYEALVVNGERVISYKGNNVFKKIDNVKKTEFNGPILNDRLNDIATKKYFYHLHKIDNGIFLATVEYFKKIKAEWCNLPLTTMMISSPGEVYAGKKLDYTTDTLPVKINWFDEEREVFLSESSQFYLELRLLIDNVDKVFSIYNSFRKEKADYCHLSEFQHVEFEGKIDSKQNIEIATNYLKYITKYLLKHNKKDLAFFLNKQEVKELSETFKKGNISEITFQDALEKLFIDTRDQKYKDFTMKNFGAWEEIRLTEIMNSHVIVTEFPMLEIPFYHNTHKTNKNGVALAQNADIILRGFRETIGSGQRIEDVDILRHKAEIFNLPKEDYEPYLQTREFKHYRTTSGFGMGWQRYVQWLLKIPYIWGSTHIPRGHLLPKP